MGSGESPRPGTLQAILCVAREDRDGSSRYRAAKMSLYRDKLGWYRVFYAPMIFIGAFSFLEALMDRTEKVELTVAVMVTDEADRLLVLDRKDARWGGLYFPGGHIEPGESAVGAAIREVYEETGLTVQNPVLCGLKQFPIPGGRYLVLFFKADRFSGILRDSSEGPVFWIGPEELPNYPLSDNFLETIQVFKSETLSEMFWSRENGNWKMELF